MKRSIYILLIIPAIILITFFMILPLLSLIFPTFFNGKFAFSSYVDFFSDSFNQTIIIRTLRVSLYTTMICIILGIPTAYYISRTKTRYKYLLSAIVLFPLLTNSVIRAFAWMNILGRNGLINVSLQSMGLIEKPLSIMYTEFAIIIGSVYLFLPIMISTVSSVMDTISDDYIEASMSLGASFFKVLFKIIIPLSASGIVVGSVLVFTGTLSAYTTPSMLGGNKKMMLTTLLNQQASALSNWDNASLIAFIMIALSLILMFIMNKLEKNLDKRGSVK